MVRVEAYVDGVTVSFQSLDGVVDDLQKAVHEASVVGGADVHASRALPPRSLSGGEVRDAL